MLSWALLPPGGVIILLVLAALVARPFAKLARLLVILGGLFLYLFSIPVVAAALIGALQVYGPASPADIAAFRAQAIVVLSAGRRSTAPEFGGETVDGLTLERIRYAAHLERQVGLPLYVAGGDPTQEGSPLAQLMATALQEDYGVAVAGMETRSDTTAENAGFLAPLLHERGIERILLVTHSWHMRRAKRAFERAGLVVLAAPTGFIDTGEAAGWEDFLPNASALNATTYALHEILGYLWYEIRDG